MKKLICFLSVLCICAAISACAEFIIDPESWSYVDIPQTSFRIKCPTGFEDIEIEDTETVYYAGDDDLSLKVISLGSCDDLETAANACELDLDSAWETTVNGIDAAGFICGEENIYGVILLDNGTAWEFDFTVSDDEERNARALNKAGMMLETITKAD